MKPFDSKAHAFRFTAVILAITIGFLGFVFNIEVITRTAQFIVMGLFGILALVALFMMTRDNKIRDEEDYGGRGYY